MYASFSLNKFIMAGKDDWQYGLEESFRINRSVLTQLPEIMFNNIKQWEEHVQLKYTNHATNRMIQYTNRLSKQPWIDQQHYIEFYPQETRYFSNPQMLQQVFCKRKCVEIGLNKNGQVCKLSYILLLHQVCKKLYNSNNNNNNNNNNISDSLTRCLFFCVGVDGYIKTLNITPTEKNKPTYGGTVPYLNFNQTIHLLQVQ